MAPETKQRYSPSNPGPVAQSFTKFVQENKVAEFPELAGLNDSISQSFFSFHNEWQRHRNVAGGEHDQLKEQRAAEKAQASQAGEAERIAKREQKEAEKAQRAQQREDEAAERTRKKEERDAERERTRATREADKAQRAEEQEAKKAERDAKKAELENARQAKADAAAAKKAERDATKPTGGATNGTEGATGRGALRESKLKKPDHAHVGASEPAF